MKRMLFLIVCCFSTNAFSIPLGASCSPAVPTTDPNFCASFKASAACYCENWGLRRNMCQDMKTIQKRMRSIFGSIENACAYQKDTSPQICLDDWKCYFSGGYDSNGNLCSGTGKSCE